ncbi:MAG TPA: MFS transporter [Spirochaetales bacterium]|nr:MFS transporter [Spirochaetales bacterium]HRY53839.1 MFS transporter [Spirochaetia bacterium]HRZ65217.1 MFS transporter [Spirochaetia bacterium]
MEKTLEPGRARRLAIELILIFGVVSLVGDVMYEGARAVNGPYLKTLGASAALVGLVAGLGELLGYATRLASGYFADKSKAYWVFTFIGYGFLASVPLLALAGTWQAAALFMVLERFGKALRAPAKDTILSTATKQIGTGLGFGLHEAMDQAGALLGPLVFTAVFAFGRKADDLSSYQAGYAWMWLPFGILMLSVLLAFLRVPDPEKLEAIIPKKVEGETLSRTFWLYTAFTFVTTLGFVGWPLLSFHYAKTGVLPGAEIALFYAVAMGVDGLVALLVGLAYDKAKKLKGSERGGLATLVVIPLVSIAIPFVGFRETKAAAIAAAMLWGVVMGTHETIMKSAIADITPIKKRGTGYGIFNTAYGLAVFASSALMGLLYEGGIAAVLVLAAIAELVALPLFLVMRKEALRPGRSEEEAK